MYAITHEASNSTVYALVNTGGTPTGVVLRRLEASLTDAGDNAYLYIVRATGATGTAITQSKNAIRDDGGTSGIGNYSVCTYMGGFTPLLQYRFSSAQPLILKDLPDDWEFRQTNLTYYVSTDSGANGCLFNLYVDEYF